MKPTIQRCFTLLLTLVLLCGLLGTVGTASDGLMDCPTLPYNQETTLRYTGEAGTQYLKFTAPATDSYTFYASDQETIAVSLANGAEEGPEIGVGSEDRYLPDDSLSAFPLVKGQTYYIRLIEDNPCDCRIRVISYTDRLKAAEQSGAPLLTEGQSVHVSYDGAAESAIFRFTPTVSDVYHFSAGRTVYKEVLGPEGVCGYEHRDTPTVDAALIAGETYLLRLWSMNGAASDFDLSVRRKGLTDAASSYPVQYKPEELAAGPLRFTVLILDDTNMKEGLIADLKAAAIQFCETLAAAPGKSYFVIVGMYNNTQIYRDYAEEQFFSANLNSVRQLIGLMDGTGKNADICTGLVIADRLLDAVRAAYGDAVETNIVLCTDGDNTAGASRYRGPYTAERKIAEEWAFASCCNATVQEARYVGSKYPLYSLAINTGRFYTTAWNQYSISDAASAFLARFLRDLASDEDKAYAITDSSQLSATLDAIAQSILSGKRVSPFLFTDVSDKDWYYNDVKTAFSTGLLNGRSATDFAPGANLTYAEAIKLAACMHQLYTEGKVTLTNGNGKWYDSYVQYAKDKGIISKDYDWGAEATRAGYVEIFAKALPAEAFQGKNSVADGAIPDVPMSHPQAAAIYKLYRAGILTGADAKGTFHPADPIRRSEVAAILTRMMYAEARKAVNLG